jgi:prevent-host-death family protein
MNHVLPVTQARKDFLSLVEKVNEEYSRVDFTKNGRIKATLVSPDYLDELEETIYTLTHSMRNIRQAEQEIAKGNYVTLKEFLQNYHAGKTIHSSTKGSKKHS